jgi:hypothetical protein
VRQMARDGQGRWFPVAWRHMGRHHDGARALDADGVRWLGGVRARVDPHSHERRPQRAKAKGVKLGRKPKLTKHQKREAIKPRDHGEETLAEIGRS